MNYIAHLEYLQANLENIRFYYSFQQKHLYKIFPEKIV